MPSHARSHAARTASILGKPDTGWRRRWYIIIFEADTVAGQRFDVLLLLAITASVLLVTLDSVESIHARIGSGVSVLEWLFTIAFTAEYIVRVLCVRRPLSYIFSFFGVIDLLSVLPAYLALFVPELHSLLDIRLLRMLRIFRVLKIPRYFDETQMLLDAFSRARRKILVFLGTVVILVVILGTVIYVIEGPQHGFTNIPVGIYWAIVTLSTTGYGDVVPRTPVGQMLTACVILLGYGIIAFPTGILGAQLAMTMMKKPMNTRTCLHCLTEGHDIEAKFCQHCGTELPPYQHDEEAVGS